MPHEPKRRHSRERKGKRRASIHLAVPDSIVCPNCSAATLPHTVCKKCGFYRGKQIIKKSRKVAQKETPAPIVDTQETE